MLRSAPTPGKALCLQHLVREPHGERTVADRAGHALRRSGADVASGEYAWPDRLEQMGLPVAQRPAVRSLARRGRLATLDVATFVEVEHQVYRLGARFGADHDEHSRSRDAVDAPVVAVAKVGVLEA